MMKITSGNDDVKARESPLLVLEAPAPDHVVPWGQIDGRIDLFYSFGHQTPHVPLPDTPLDSHPADVPLAQDLG